MVFTSNMSLLSFLLLLEFDCNFGNKLDISEMYVSNSCKGNYFQRLQCYAAKPEFILFPPIGRDLKFTSSLRWKVSTFRTDYLIFSQSAAVVRLL